MIDNTKAREQAARRAAARKGWRLENCRIRPENEHNNNRGGWQIIDANNNVIGGVDYELSLADIESWVRPDTEEAETLPEGFAEYNSTRNRIEALLATFDQECDANHDSPDSIRMLIDALAFRVAPEHLDAVMEELSDSMAAHAAADVNGYVREDYREKLAAIG